MHRCIFRLERDFWPFVGKERRETVDEGGKTSLDFFVFHSLSLFLLLSLSLRCAHLHFISPILSTKESTASNSRLTLLQSFLCCDVRDEKVDTVDSLMDIMEQMGCKGGGGLIKGIYGSAGSLCRLEELDDDGDDKCDDYGRSEDSGKDDLLLLENHVVIINNNDNSFNLLLHRGTSA